MVAKSKRVLPMDSIKNTLRAQSYRRFEVLAVVASLIIGCIGLTKWGVWFDESFTIRLIQFDFTEVIRRTALDVHPPLYYLVLKLWSLAFGFSLFSLRFFGVLCYALSIFVWGRVARELYNEKIAKLSLLLLVLGPFTLRYAQEIRMYTFAAIFVGLATLYFIKLYRNPRSFKFASLYVLSVLACLYTHYFSVLFVAVHLGVILVELIRSASFQTLKKHRILISSYAVVALGFLPWLPTLISQTKRVTGGFWIPQISPTTLPDQIARYVFNTDTAQFTELNGDRAGLILTVALSLVVVSLLVVIIKSIILKDTKLQLLLGTALIPPLIVFVLSLPPMTPLFVARYFAYFAPAFYVGVAAAIATYIGRRWQPFAYALTLSLFTVGILNSFFVGNYNWHTKTYATTEPVAEFLHESVDVSQDGIIVRGAEEYLNTLYYYETTDGHSITTNVYAQSYDWFNDQFPLLQGDILKVAQIDELPMHYNFAWVVYDCNNAPQIPSEQAIISSTVINRYCVNKVSL